MNIPVSAKAITQKETTTPHIAFDKVSVKVNQSVLLSDVSLTIDPGTWVGVVGPNGGGKSTLIKALLGIVPHRGTISYTWPGKHKGNIGYVPQLAPFESTLPVTVLDYLRMVLEDRPVWWRRKPNQRIQQGMENFDIRDFADKRLGTLSTGERQRVLICGALLQSPDVLLLDEPLAGVDKSGQQRLLEILKQYHAQGNTIIMVEHHWHIVEQYCQRAALIDGTLVAVDTPQKVLLSLQEHADPLTLSYRQ